MAKPITQQSKHKSKPKHQINCAEPTNLKVYPNQESKPPNIVISLYTQQINPTQ